LYFLTTEVKSASLYANADQNAIVRNNNRVGESI